MSDLSYFRTRLRDRRKELGITQVQLGKICGVTPQEISHFETGRRAPELLTFITLCMALSLRPNDLLRDYFTPENRIDLSYDDIKDRITHHIHGAMYELNKLNEYNDMLNS